MNQLFLDSIVGVEKKSGEQVQNIYDNIDSSSVNYSTLIYAKLNYTCACFMFLLVLYM